jgi:hypothetical protein
MKKVEPKTKKQLIMDNHKLKLQNVLLEKQKQEALLQKEQNAKLLKQLEFYEKACKHQPEQPAPTPKNECMPSAPLSPVFQEIVESLEFDLSEQTALIYDLMSKIVNIDGGIHFEEPNEDKVFNSGVCDILRKHCNHAKENRIKLEVIKQRLKSLVG